MAIFPITSPDLLGGSPSVTKVITGGSTNTAMQVIYQTSGTLNTVLTPLDFGAAPGKFYLMQGVLYCSTTTANSVLRIRLSQRVNNTTGESCPLQFGAMGGRGTSTSTSDGFDEATGFAAGFVSTAKGVRAFQTWTEYIELGLPQMTTGNEPGTSVGPTVIPVFGSVDARLNTTTQTVETAFCAGASAAFPGARVHHGSWLRYTEVTSELTPS